MCMLSSSKWPCGSKKKNIWKRVAAISVVSACAKTAQSMSSSLALDNAYGNMWATSNCSASEKNNNIKHRYFGR